MLVEDEVVIAMLIEDMVTALGAVAIGPAYNLRSGIAIAETEALDGAILDFNLSDGNSTAIADILAERGIPFIFATGYGSAIPNVHDALILQKPYQISDIDKALGQIFGS